MPGARQVFVRGVEGQIAGLRGRGHHPRVNFIGAHLVWLGTLSICGVNTRRVLLNSPFLRVLFLLRTSPELLSPPAIAIRKLPFYRPAHHQGLSAWFT